MGFHIAIRAFNGAYLCAEKGGGREVVANRRVCKEWEMFSLESISTELVCMRCFDGHFVCADESRGGLLVADRSERRDWETFRIAPVEQGFVAFKSSSGKYLCAENGGGGKVVANRDAVGDWEMFEIVPLDSLEPAQDDAYYLNPAVSIALRILKEVVFAKKTDLDEGEKEARDQRRDNARREWELYQEVYAPAPKRDESDGGRPTRDHKDPGPVFRGDINTHPDTPRTA